MFRKKEEDIPGERKQAILLKIRPVFAKTLQIDEDKITLASKINEDLNVDSLDTIEIIMALEEEFNIEILDTDAEKMETVEDVVVYLAERIKE